MDRAGRLERSGTWISIKNLYGSLGHRLGVGEAALRGIKTSDVAKEHRQARMSHVEKGLFHCEHPQTKFLCLIKAPLLFVERS